MSERVHISESELPLETPPFFDPVLKVFKGVPWHNDGKGNHHYAVPDTPHIHKAHVIHTDDHNNTLVSPGQVTVLVAHGYSSEGKWVFADGREVDQFYEQYNINNPNDPIRCLAVCNPTDEVVDSRVQHALGTNVSVTGFMHPNGETMLRIRQTNNSRGVIHTPWGDNQEI